MADSSKFTIHTFMSAKNLPKIFWEACRNNPRSSNIIFPHAEMALFQEQSGIDGQTKGIWIICITSHSIHRPPSVDFILSCTEDATHVYPIFISTPFDFSRSEDYGVRSRLSSLALALSRVVTPERVFSVFAPEPITHIFASEWSALSGIPLASDPEYYAAKFAYCTRQTYKVHQLPMCEDVTYKLRLADESDISQAGLMCHGFAAAAEPFTLSPEHAFTEAVTLIGNRQLWVHDIIVPGQNPEIASIVAVNRTSDTVAAITKVFTNPKWRKRRCAERLTRHVCEHLLRTKVSVVLYVAHNNPAAATVYDRVGFVGVHPEMQPQEGVDRWLELGFDRSKVVLGHW